MRIPEGRKLVPVEPTPDVEGYEDPDSGQWVSEKQEEKDPTMNNYGDYRPWFDPVTTNIAAAPTPPAQEDKEILQVIDERDQYHEWADKLADAIAKRFGIEIGEHSNLNSPWENALEAIEAPAQEDEPVGYKLTYKSGRTSFIDRGPDSFELRECAIEPLYTRPKSDELRKAAEEVAQELFGADFSDSRIRACYQKLRAALKGES